MRPDATGRLRGPSTPLTRPVAPPAPQPEARPRRGSAPGDRFERTPDATPAAPFWLVKMAQDRMAQRRYMSDAETRELASREPGFVAWLAEAVAPAVAEWGGAHELASYQDLAARLTPGFVPPRVVSQGALRGGRGQFLFQADGSLLQLKLDAPGTPAEWIATVAHECFHHLQQELVSALYQDRAISPEDVAALARYYRDARAVYLPLGPDCPPERHRRQALELGAWAFGARVAEMRERAN